MKNRRPGDEDAGGPGKTHKAPPDSLRQHKKNMKRLGGGGLSLEAFAGMKSNRSHYNPGIIKQKREFYKNAKFVNKYKKTLKHLDQQNHPSKPKPFQQNKAEADFDTPQNKGNAMNRKSNKKDNRRGSNSLNKLYEKKLEEEEKARKEKEAIIKARKEEQEKAEARRKAEREKMLKRTRKGQPVMKYRIENILKTIQGSTSK